MLGEILSSLGAELAAHPFFWALFALALVLVIICSLQCFEKKWLRALIAGGLAVECAWFLSAGYV